LSVKEHKFAEMSTWQQEQSVCSSTSTSTSISKLYSSTSTSTKYCIWGYNNIYH